MMATEEHQPQAGHEILSKHSSSPSMGSRPLRDKAHTSPGQEVWRGCDQLWLSKQRSSPALLFYRKLSCESVNGVNSAEEYEEVLSTKDKLLAELSADMNYEGIKNILGDSDTDRTNCVSSDHSTSLNTNSDSRSSPSSCTSCLTKRHIRRGSLPVSMLAFCKTSHRSFPGSPSSEPSSLASSPCGSPCLKHRQHLHQGNLPPHRLKDGFSSLERLNRRPRGQKCPLEKLFLPRSSADAMTLDSSFPGTGRDSSSEEEDEEALSDEAELIRNRKDRSTVLVRRYFKNNQKVTKSVCAGTIAIVRTLPSGHISEDVWGIVVDHRSWHPSKKDVWWILQRGEEFRGCRGILGFNSAKLQQVNNYVKSREECSLIHPANKLLLSWPGCVHRRDPPGPLNVDNNSSSQPDLHYRCDLPRCYRACGWRTSLCSLLAGAILEATVALGARSSLLCPPPQCPNSHIVLKERQLANSMTSSISLPQNVSGISKELAELRHLIQFPEEIACILTEQEQQLYQQVLPLDYLCFLTQDLGSPECQIKRHPNLKASLSAPNMPTRSPRRSNAVEDLVARFNEVSSWVTWLVLTAGTMEEKREVFSYLVHVAKCCWNMGNYNGVMEFLAGLRSRKVLKMWQFMDQSDIETIRSLKDAMAQHESSSEYKKVMTRALNIPGCKVVPFCGVFLKELSDALDGTASIISLKQSPDKTDDSVEFMSDYSGQHHFLTRSGPDGLHVPDKEATVSNILQIIRSCNRSLEAEDPDDTSSSPSPSGSTLAFRSNSLKDRYRNHTPSLRVRGAVPQVETFKTATYLPQLWMRQQHFQIPIRGQE
ncbi:1-phosphatidylinositol 4,5-bisphosphate phosphodiesterase epsilon-1 [Oryzias melastigma]|uniref:1-phosphatidylinositol 4,5-bisphosphate phosphodiesterase epsilon-1 n=1 Tax=Oryzias melastigma TaxID=30732 RepID=A0A834FJJ5_ORYME|nr:1-phosphatidylinositol 4,5-bisphosphate phosphodiesterase epsilon-1 [Oryzias melastigma]